MSHHAHGPALLEAARATLLDELLETLPEERRYTLRMAANAMAIAAREARAGTAAQEQELGMLEQLYGRQPAQAQAETPAQRLAGLNRRLAKDIRNGALDGACATGVRALLLHQVCARLRICNPRYLSAAGLE